MSVLSNQEAHLTLLVEALNGLKARAAAQPKGRPVALIIDEFQKVIELGGIHAESQVRAAIQRHVRVGYVFAGSKTRLLTAVTMDAARPFYRLGTVRFIGPLPKANFVAFLRSKFEESGDQIDDEAALEAILDLSEQVPYNVQMLAHTCWDQLRTRPKQAAILTSRVVNEAIRPVLHANMVVPDCGLGEDVAGRSSRGSRSPLIPKSCLIRGQRSFYGTART